MKADFLVQCGVYFLFAVFVLISAKSMHILFCHGIFAKRFSHEILRTEGTHLILMHDKMP